MAITPRDAIPREWVKKVGSGPIGIGLDLATTEKKTSNPSSFTVTERVGPRYVERLVARFKTSNEEVIRQMMRIILTDLRQADRRVRRVCVDATNERLFANALRKELSIFCPVVLVIASESVKWQGEELDSKTVISNLYVNTYTEGLIACPDERWLREDRRLVYKEAGRFQAHLSPDGGHADTFSSGSLARWALEGGGRAEAAGVAVGAGIGGSALATSQLKNPLLKLAQQKITRRTVC